MIFGEKLRAIRRNHHLTQAELSRLSGIGKNLISDYECGKHEPSVFMAESLLNVMGYRFVIEKIEIAKETDDD